MKVVELVSLSIELEENLYQQLYKFIKSNPDWDISGVLSESLGLFLEKEKFSAEFGDGGKSCVPMDKSSNRVSFQINYRDHHDYE